MMENEPIKMKCPGCAGMLHLPDGKEDWEHTGPYDLNCPMNQEVGSDDRNDLLEHPHESYEIAQYDHARKMRIQEMTKGNVNESGLMVEGAAHPVYSALQKAGLEARLENGTMTDNVVSLDEFRAQKAKQ
jgi:hypothetical protein